MPFPTATRIFGDRRFTQREIADRSRRLATSTIALTRPGVHTDRADLTGDQVGQDLVGFYTYNGNEYVESMHAAFGRAWHRSTSTTATSRASSNTCSTTPRPPR